jgi:hypothetical protein
MKKILYIILGVIAILAIYALGSFAWNKLSYEDALQKINNIKGVETCQSIPSHTYNTFLIFNPSDYQTYYFRSECYQKVALQTRDVKLCDQVKERKSFFLNGSAVSQQACLKAVNNQESQDFAERVKPESIHKIEKVEINPTLSGDFDVKVFPAGTLWGTYKFSVSLLDSSGKFIGILDELDTHLSDRKDPLSTTLYRQKIQQLVGSQLKSGQMYNIQVSLKLLRDDAGQLQRSNLSQTQLESIKNQSITF